MRAEAEYERITPRAWSSSDPVVLAWIGEASDLPLATRALPATAWRMHLL